MRKIISLTATLFIIGCGGNSNNRDMKSVDINGNHNNIAQKYSVDFRKSISLDDKIAGLYIFYFNRAPDWDGFNYWKSRGYSDSEALNILSYNFSQHEVFTSTYSDLDNREFVEAIYSNVLGKDGDEEGIEYWTSELNRGVSRSDMVSNFVESSLGSDIDKENFPNLSDEELNDAQERQDLISNKVDVALYFTESLQDKSNISNINNPEDDPSYQASIKILDGVTSDSTSVDIKKEYIDTIVNKSNPIDIILNGDEVETQPTPTPTPTPTPNNKYPTTEIGIQEALDNENYDYVISQLTSNREDYKDLSDDEVNINIAGAYVGKSGYSVFDITTAISNSENGLNEFVFETTKDNDALYTINQLEEADRYYSKVIDGVNCEDSTITEEQKLACYSLGLVRLTSLSNSVKLLFGGDEDVVQSWAEGVDINSSDDLNGNGVIDEADASGCAIVYADNPSNSCREGAMATYRKKVTFIKDGISYETTMIDVDIGNPNLGYTTFKKLITDNGSGKSVVLTDGICDINFNKSTYEIDGEVYFPCPVIDDGKIMNISDSLKVSYGIQNLFPVGSTTRTTIESYIENITGSPDGVITQDNLGIYLQSH